MRVYEPTVNRAKHIGENTRVGAFCDIGAGVEIGDGCNIQCHCSISNSVKIGNGVFLGPGVRILNDKYVNGLCQPPEIGDYSRIGRRHHTARRESWEKRLDRGWIRNHQGRSRRRNLKGKW